jgi:hypothetical protein
MVGTLIKTAVAESSAPTGEPTALGEVQIGCDSGAAVSAGLAQRRTR